jgi:2'-5' RNA ligase
VARVRLGVVLLVAEPWRTEINGLRRALGDRNLDRIPPHITLVPPINVKADDMQLVFDTVCSAAENMQPFAVQLGPVTTFAPKTPVIKLDVQGEGRACVERLREEIAVGPLLRESQWPFDAHVTLNDEASDDLIVHALASMSYVVDTTLSDVWVLQQEEDRVWRPFMDARFEPSTTVGAGGLAITITTSTLLDSVVKERLNLDVQRSTMALIARINGEAVGALAIREGRSFELLALRVHEAHRRLGVGSHLLRHAYFLARQQGFTEILDASACPDVAALLQRFR